MITGLLRNATSVDIDDVTEAQTVLTYGARKRSEFYNCNNTLKYLSDRSRYLLTVRFKSGVIFSSWFDWTV